MAIKRVFKQLYRKIISQIQIPQSLLKKTLFLFKIFKKDSNKLKIGFCPVCGKNSFMILRNDILRETGECLYCSANSRYKAMAEIIKRVIIITLFNDNLDISILEKLLNRVNLTHYSLKQIIQHIRNNDFWIYEPSSIGAIYNILKRYPRFIKSEYFPIPNLKPGDTYKGIRYEDLHNLSFKNNFFDLIITLDVLEHVRDSRSAFKEISRVLKDKGIHIFTVPLENRKVSIKRIDEKDNILIRPVIYHSDGIRTKGPVVYTDWGLDIIEFLNKLQFPSFIFSIKDVKLGIFSEIKIIISIKA